MICNVISLKEAEDLLEKRFILVATFGGLVASFGIVANALLAVIFLSKKNFRHSPYFFLGFVALLDTLLDTVYIMLLCIPVIDEFFDLRKLHLIWISYARTTFLFGQVFKIASVLCLIVASLERYILTKHWTFTGFEYKTRWILLVCSISSAFILRLITSHDVVIVSMPECDFYNRIFVGQLSKNNFVSGLISFVTIFIPFCTLIFLNGGTVVMLKKQHIQELRSLITQLTMGHDVMEIRRRNLRAATHTLLFIISAYLISNILNLILSFVEFFYPGVLHQSYPYYYRLFADLSSVLTVLGNAIRFPAHLFSNMEIREQICFTSKTDKIEILPGKDKGSRRGSHVDTPWFSILYTANQQHDHDEVQIALIDETKPITTKDTMLHFDNNLNVHRVSKATIC
uniref:G_PROTEIN_RECEP_F1_2 domain-containing protein n=1 Tax=Rhabditophanes sp. KR3021 TaxID=114890 RepID=A0AC35U8N7_9BILA